jgi:ABC-type phosphate transport system substrate-binding protein
MRKLISACLLSLCAHAAAGVVLIGHAGVPRLDDATVQKIYSGKMVEVSGISVTAVNQRVGSLQRNQFLQTYLNQDEEKYTAYWTVRRYIGKGVPPRELAGSADVINFVQTTPGALGYIDESDVKPGLNVLLRK